MAENLGKRAQQVREQRLKEQEANIRRKINHINSCSKRIESNISTANDILRWGRLRKKDEFGDKIRVSECKNEIKEDILSIENGLVELQALDEQKNAVLSPHYLQKLPDWKKQLNSIVTRIRWIRIIKYTIIVGFILWILIDDIIEHGI